VTLEVTTTFKVNASKVKITAWITYQHQKNAQISCRRLNLVKTVSEPSATRHTTFKARSLGQTLKSQ